ncbi:MAG: hypothetical protein AAF401_07445 [Pseudomonadota bacterium]
MNRFQRSLVAVAALISSIATSANAASITVDASGVMPGSAVTDGDEIWSFSGAFSDQLTDVFAGGPSGTFEFEPSDLATLSFTVDGDEIAFLTPTQFLLDSRIVLSPDQIAFSLFFDASDPFFGGQFSNAVFTITVPTAVQSASDPTVLSTFDGVPENSPASTSFILTPNSGTPVTQLGEGEVSAEPVSEVPLPASLPLLLAGLVGLRLWTRKAGPAS